MVTAVYTKYYFVILYAMFFTKFNLRNDITQQGFWRLFHYYLYPNNPFFNNTPHFHCKVLCPKQLSTGDGGGIKGL